MTNPYDPTFPGQPRVLPSADDVVTPLIDELVGNPAALAGKGNPRRGDHLQIGAGYWSNVVAGWRAQAALNLRRVADEMMQSRLPLASKLGLRELAKSKYFTDCIDTPINAVGNVVMSVTNAAGNATATIPEGTRFRRDADPTAFPFPIPSADFESTAPVNVPGTGVQTVDVPIRCTTPGTLGNILLECYPTSPGHFTLKASGTDMQLVDNLTQLASASVTSASCAGGCTSFSDDDVKRICYAQPQGRRGPTPGALVAGALLASGTRHVAEVEDLVNAMSWLYASDTSWASDPNFWNPLVQQFIADNWQGFGCALSVGYVANCPVDVSCTIQVRSANLLAQTSALEAVCRKALTAYLDGVTREDWWNFKSIPLRAMLSGCDPRILTCSAISASNYVAGTDPLDAADPTTQSPLPSFLPHYTLSSLTITFIAPE